MNEESHGLHGNFTVINGNASGNGCNNCSQNKDKAVNGRSNFVAPKIVPGFHEPSSLKMMKYRRLGNTDLIVSALSIGGSGFGNVYGDINEDSATHTLHTALKKGLNYIDTAPWYGQGQSESFLGRALSGVPRDAYIISTKIGRYEVDTTRMFDFTAAKTFQSVEESLRRLKLPYVDILQVHDVEFAPSIDMIVNETLPALQKLKEQGKCRYIGITGYPIASLKEAISKSHLVEIDTVLSYCHLTLNDSTLLQELDFFRQRGLPVINASPVGMGLLCRAGPPPWHPAGEKIKKACREAVQYCQDEAIDITKLAIYHSISHEQVPTTLTSITTMPILESNLDTIYNGLTDREMEAMGHIQKHFFDPLPVKTWEGVEVKEYWSELHRLRQSS